MPYKRIATITSKGQVTVPAEIRERLGIRAGDRLSFDLSESGCLTITPIKRKSIFEDFHEVRLPSLGRVLTRTDINEASEAAAMEKFGRASKAR